MRQVSIEGPSLQGAPISLERLKGQVVLINFWASWCASCRVEMPIIDAYYRTHRQQGLEVLALSLDEAQDQDAASQMAARYAFPSAMMHSLRISGLKRIWRMPVCAVVDRHGVLAEEDVFFEPALDTPALDRLLHPYW